MTIHNLKTGAAWLAGQLKTIEAQPIIYRRGQDQLSITASVGQTSLMETNVQGVVQQHLVTDFLVNREDLATGFNDSSELPVRGDQIDITQNQMLVTYELMSQGQEAFWRFSDSHETIIRMHCKEIKRTPVNEQAQQGGR